MPISGTAPNKTFTRAVNVYTGSDAWQQLQAAGRKILSADQDSEGNDISTALNVMWMRDGGNQPSANLPMNSKKFTGAANASASGEFVTYSQVIGVLNAASTTSLLCFDAAAPTGWTIDTAFTDCAVRIHTEGGGTAGTVGFTTTFTSHTPTGGADGHTLTTDEIPSHSHGVTDPGHVHASSRTPNQATATGGAAAGYAAYSFGNTYSATTGISINNAGGGGAHTHTLTMDAINLGVKYMNAIKINKD